MTMIVREPRSSAIQRIGFNTLSGEMQILFRKGGRYPEYIFGGMDEERVIAFMGAPSVGQYYHKHIKDNPRFTVGKRLGSYRLGAFGRRLGNVFRFK